MAVASQVVAVVATAPGSRLSGGSTCSCLGVGVVPVGGTFFVAGQGSSVPSCCLCWGSSQLSVW